MSFTVKAECSLPFWFELTKCHLLSKLNVVCLFGLNVLSVIYCPSWIFCIFCLNVLHTPCLYIVLSLLIHYCLISTFYILWTNLFFFYFSNIKQAWVAMKSRKYRSTKTWQISNSAEVFRNTVRLLIFIEHLHLQRSRGDKGPIWPKNVKFFANNCKITQITIKYTRINKKSYSNIILTFMTSPWHHNVIFF